MGGFAWVTLATNDSYSMGALVLAHSLRHVNTAHHLVVLITPGVTEAMKTQLSAVFNVVKLVDVLDSKDAENLALLARPELGITFTKLHCWKLTEYEKCVFLDADTLVLQNSDELFEREELSAAPDAGWPDCFNSGVFVYKPSSETFKALIEFSLIHGSFDGGDQGLLNLFFSDWPTKDIKKHLPFVYNMCSTATYSYLPAFKQFGHDLKIVHFIGSAKPWLQPFNTETGLARVSGESQHVSQFVQFWWDLFCTHVHPSLSSDMTRHRLSSCYVFSTPPVDVACYRTQQSSHIQPVKYDVPQDDLVYFDPWDQYVVENCTDCVTQEVFQTYSNFVDNQNVFSSNSVITNSEYNSKNETQYINSACAKDCSVTPHCNQHHGELSNDRSPMQAPVSHGVDSFNVPFGGGNEQEVCSSRSSREGSFSQLEQSLNEPIQEQNEAEQIVVDWHSHAPSPTQQLPPSHQHSSVDCHPQQQLPSEPGLDAGLAGALASITLGTPLTAEQSALEEHLRRQGWEQGNIDYMGKDSFSNIWQKISDTLVSGGQQPPVHEVSPVAPIAAPVYVSSVEISPAGPIDTSPPANYAPVSATKPTVADSNTETVPKAISPESSTVVYELKSPSVTEVASTECKIASSPKIETPEQLTTSSAPISESTSVSTAPETKAIAETTPVPSTEPAIVLETLESSLPTKSEIAPIPPASKEEVPVSAATEQSALTSQTEAVVGTKAPVNDTKETLTPTIPTETTATSTPILTETPATPTPTSTEAPATPVSTATEAPATPIPTSTEAPAVPVPTPTEAPATLIPTSTDAPATPTPTSTEAPAIPVPTPTEAPIIPVPTPTEAPIIPVPTPTEAPIIPVPTPTEAPIIPVTTPTEAPVIPPPISTETTPVPTVTDASTTSTPTPTDAPAISTPTLTETPVLAVTTDGASVPLKPIDSPVPETPAKETSPLKGTTTTQSEISVTVGSPPSKVIDNIVSPLTEVQPTIEQPSSVTAEVPPPTSAESAVDSSALPQPTPLPPATESASAGAPIEVPTTPVVPAVGTSSTPADEPPIPPKRKGSKASQEAKNQKSKPAAKGKK